MTKIRHRLSSKHQEIAERLSSMLSKSVKDQAQVSTLSEVKGALLYYNIRTIGV